MTERPAALDAAAYTRLYESEYPRLVGYARTLTGNPWMAGDLVAEAHFRVWRRLSALCFAEESEGWTSGRCF